MLTLPYLGPVSGLGLLWGSLSGAYMLKGLYQGVGGSNTHRDFDGEKGLLRFSKRPISRLFLGIGVNGAVCIAVYNSYCFGFSNFRWLQYLVDHVSTPGVVSTDKMSVLLGSSLLMVHTVLRWYQSVYINVFSTTATIGLLDWLSPYVYAVCAGLTLVSEAPALDGAGFGWFSWSSVSWRHSIGCVLFLLLTYYDNKVQYSLAKFRKNRAGHVVSEDHKMPKGGMFDIVSSPQLLGEILFNSFIGITLGFEHKSWWLCAGYVAVSQVVRALGRQQWYRKKYEALPATRKAVIPFVL